MTPKIVLKSFSQAIYIEKARKRKSFGTGERMKNFQKEQDAIRREQK